MGRHRIPLAGITENRTVVELEGRELVVFLVDGRAHAFENACPHAGNPLVHGEIAGPLLVCAYHGWRFDLESGACLAGDAPARRFQAEIHDGAVWIDIDE